MRDFFNIFIINNLAAQVAGAAFFACMAANYSELKLKIMIAIVGNVLIPLLTIFWFMSGGQKDIQNGLIVLVYAMPIFELCWIVDWWTSRKKKDHHKR